MAKSTNFDIFAIVAYFVEVVNFGHFWHLKSTVSFLYSDFGLRQMTSLKKSEYFSEEYPNRAGIQLNRSKTAQLAKLEISIFKSIKNERYSLIGVQKRPPKMGLNRMFSSCIRGGRPAGWDKGGDFLSHPVMGQKSY